MKNLSKGEKIFLIYSVVNFIAILCSIEEVGIFNADIAFGMFVSWILYIYSYLFYCYMNIGK